MLSYQHVYHAGNHVDCQKHLVLTILLQYLKEKDTPLCYIDTHSGRGLYDLFSPEAQKIREHETGIGKIWDVKTWPDAARPYKEILSSLNKNGRLHYYPGSPWVAHALMRPQDRCELFELHPQEYKALREKMGRLPNVDIFQEDGWSVLGKYLPPKENRGLVFIDPSYELKDDYDVMAVRLQNALKYWRNGIFVIWYPILQRGLHEFMKEDFIESGMRKILCNEIMYGTENGIAGSGILVVNPPWKSNETISELMTWLSGFIGVSSTTSWLVPE